MSRRILLFYISANSGHHRATQAIERAVSIIDPVADVLSLDGLTCTTPVMAKIVSKTYLEVIRRKPEIWQYLYDNKNVERRIKKLRTFIHRHNSPKLLSVLEDFQPDVVACTQAYPCGMIADLKKNHNLKTPLVGILTDYIAHIYWFNNEIDTYVVPSESISQRLQENGIFSDKIRTFGIPLYPDFLEKIDSNRMTQKLGLQKDLPVVLIMGGSRGVGPIEKMVSLIDTLDCAFQSIIICGTNHKLYNWFTKNMYRFRKKIALFGYVNNIHELMEVSDAVITKPGGLTTQEALCKGLPMLIVNPIPGQEQKNTEFLVSIGAAEKAQNYKELAFLLKQLFENPAKLQMMKQKALINAKPNSAFDTAKLLLGMN